MGAGVGIGYLLANSKTINFAGCFTVLVKRWDMLDTNKDGKVSKEEFIVGCKNLYGGGKDLSTAELEKLHAFIIETRQHLDTNKDGQISTAELFTGIKAA